MDTNLKDIKITIIGLGYVGLPLAAEFSRYFPVVGYDINQNRIKELKSGYDRTHEIENSMLSKLKNLNFTFSKKDIKDSNVYIITVPTPVDINNNPDMNALREASKLVGSVIKKDEIVIYESTVFPGATEEICVPLIEDKSGLKYNIDFFCGYSPERINPGDKKNKLSNIVKITSGSSEKASDFVDALYKIIVKVGTYKATSIKVAEAAKVIENTQRDVNIALINELALIFNKLGLDTLEVLKAAGTKWNFLPFRPGLVGGHCIGVDPYYLMHKAKEVGHHPEIILAGRRINDTMGAYVADTCITELAKKEINISKAKILVMGLTFKENCPDFRNSKVIDIINQLKKYNCSVDVTDTVGDSKEAREKYGINLKRLDSIEGKYNAAIVAVNHSQYLEIGLEGWMKILYKDSILIDVKSIYKKYLFEESSIKHWRL